MLFLSVLASNLILFSIVSNRRIPKTVRRIVSSRDVKNNTGVRNLRDETFHKNLEFLEPISNAPSECTAIVNNAADVELVPMGSLLIDTVNNHNPAFKRIWNGILKRIENSVLILRLGFDAVTADATFSQYGPDAGGNPPLQKSQLFSESFIRYGLAVNTFGDGASTCLIEIKDDNVLAPFTDLYLTYNADIQNWFFCPKAAIRLYLNPIGSAVLSFKMEIVFDDECGVNIPNLMSTTVFSIDGQEWMFVAP